VTEQDFAGLVPESVAAILVDAHDEAAWIAAAPTTPPPVSISADDIAHVHHTSGFTGEPKRIPVTHANLGNVFYAVSEAPGVSPDDIVCTLAPITFDVISQEIYIPLIVGARAVFADSDTLRDGQALAELIDKDGHNADAGHPDALAHVDRRRFAGPRRLQGADRPGSTAPRPRRRDPRRWHGASGDLMTPIYLGEPDRRLFGIYEPAVTAKGTPRAAVLCHPFAQEQIRALPARRPARRSVASSNR
jgi:acyl-CoA synthetase (AMP-forming)/AMP-acid ligase II